MEKVLQEKLVDGILGIFKDASEKGLKPEDTEDTENKDVKDVDKDVQKDVQTPVGITPEQFLAGLEKMGENIVVAFKEASKTPEQRSEENKGVAVEAVKQYLVQEGFDLKDQTIEINFSETKKGGGIQDGNSLELKLVKSGTELKPKGEEADDDGENQYATVDDIPEDVQKAASREIWRNMLRKKS